jgi:L-arabinokinase
VIVAYVSGHGFGHATRTAEVLRAIRRRSPGLSLCIVSSAPEALFRTGVRGPFLYRHLECDVGLAQRGSLVIDPVESLERFRAFKAGHAERLAAEVEFLGGCGARLVLGDVPPLAFAAAADAGLPSVALANFSWDWIYRHLAPHAPGFEWAASQCARAYAQATLLLELPFPGDLSVFPHRERIPLVARPPRMTREEARAHLGLPEGRLVLFSFGGFGLPDFDPEVLTRLPEYTFLTTGLRGPRPSHVIDVPLPGLRYEDLVRAADVVVTKPGYGIVTDAIAAGTRIVYTERGEFPEYPILVREMVKLVPCAHVSNADLLTGHLEDALESVLAAPLPPPPRLDGADVAAERLLDLYHGGAR